MTGDGNRDLAAARRVITTEIAGLEALVADLDNGGGDAFARAVAVLAEARGRVVLTGMGKSGHVARKIAATLASTGTPAQYVHPGEASHGDLGMIGTGDVVVALSNSGETAELSDIIAFTRRFSIPLVALTRDETSSLGDAADVVLRLPPAAEACPLGLAPTTSTTLMLALGDALAVALLERKGFTGEDFRNFHPGGKLGQQLQTVKHLMRSGDAVPLVGETADMGVALIEMTSKSLGCVGIVDPAGRLVGIITDGDLRRHMSASLPMAPVAQVMSRKPKTIKPTALAAEAVWQMNQHKVTSLFVVDAGGLPAGLIHIHDCLLAGVV